MTTKEAKFILSAYRPGGGDAGDARFSEVLRKAGEDPELSAWFSQSRALDGAVAEKLRNVAPPAGLRDAILAGGRVSRSEDRRHSRWGWMAALAAAAAVAAAVIFTHATPAPSPGAFADFAINDMVHGRHGSSGPASASLVGALQAQSAPMPGADAIDFEGLKATGCRTLSFAGRDVVEVCFVRSGADFHFYVARRVQSTGDLSTPSIVSEASGAAAVWADGRYVYALASTAGAEAIRRLL